MPTILLAQRLSQSSSSSSTALTRRSSIADYIELDGAALVVTGASSGIGRAFAIEASRHGARIALCARREDALEEVKSSLSGDGHIVAPYDLSALEGIPDLLKGIAREMGPLSGLVHAAGIHSTSSLRGITPEQLSSMFEINVSTAFMLAKGFRHKQVRDDHSSIVFLSSVAGMTGQAGVSVYSATKGAVASLARSLAVELAREGIRVNSVAPGIVETELTAGIRSAIGAQAWADVEAAHPLGIGSADDVAKAILYLVSPASRWATGTSLVIDGGYTAQ